MSLLLVEAPPFVLPRIGALLRHAAPRVLESMILPVALFYAGLVIGGEMCGVLVSAAWVYGGLVLRLVRRSTVPGSLLLAVVGISARVVVTLLTGNALFFFLPPTLGVFCVSLTFLCTAGTARPLAQRITADLAPLPGHVVAHPVMRRFFVRQSLVWGLAQLANGVLTLWLLLGASLGTFLAVRTAAVAVLLGAVALGTVLDFRASLARTA
jgi:hypothetical protein